MNAKTELEIKRDRTDQVFGRVQWPHTELPEDYHEQNMRRKPGWHMRDMVYAILFTLLVGVWAVIFGAIVMLAIVCTIASIRFLSRCLG